MKKNVQVNFHSTLFTVYTLSKKSSLNGLRFWKKILWVFISKGTMSQCVLRCRFLLTSYIWQIWKIILFFKACLDFFRAKNLIFESTKSKSFGLGHFFMILLVLSVIKSNTITCEVGIKLCRFGNLYVPRLFHRMFRGNQIS